METITVAQKIGNAEKVFLARLWGDDFECAYISGKPQGGVWTDTPVHSMPEALAEAARRTTQGGDVYMSCAMFGNAGGRKAANAKGLSAFYLDLDTGADKATKGKGHRTKKEAAVKLAEFRQKVGVPVPTLVDSGNGLHVYLFLDRPVPLARWKPVAEKLKALTHTHGLLADDAVTADAARVLRFPGSFNYKDPANLKPVTIKRMMPPASAEALIAAIEKAYSEIVPTKSEAVPAFMTAERGNLDAVLITETPEAVARMKSALNKLSPDCGRAEWRNIVWAVMAHGFACCVDVAREWSMRSPKYNEADFRGVVRSFKS